MDWCKPIYLALYVCVCVLVIYNKKELFAATVHLKCAEEQQKSASSVGAAPGRLFEGFGPLRLDQRTSLFVCFYLGGAPEGYSPPPRAILRFPPQDSPSGLSLLEPLWPLRHPVLPRDGRSVLSSTKGKTLEGCRQNQIRTRVRAGVQAAPPPGWRAQQWLWYATFLSCSRVFKHGCDGEAMHALSNVNSCTHTHARGKKPPPLLTSTSSPTRPWGEEGWHQTVIQSLRQPCNRPAKQRHREREYSQMIICWLTVVTSDEA